MKKLVVLLLASLVATSAFAIIDPDPDMMGIYFDVDANTNVLDGQVANLPFFTYLILTNTTATSVKAYELGVDNVFDPGNTFFMLANLVANGEVDGINVGAPTSAGGDYIVGLSAPIPARPAIILHSWQYMMSGVAFPVAMYIHASSVPSIPGNLPVIEDGASRELSTVGTSTGGPEFPVAGVNFNDIPVAVEESSFGSVKSLFR